MSTHKSFNLIAILALILAVILTVFCICGTSLGLIVTSHAMGYEERLFDTEKVHTIDIVMDNWDEFIASCQSEEYSPCTVVIDGEKYADIGLRAKGNTSLSNVASLNSQRYSFKLEFDQYESGKTYHGLDKLCLNNIIQDNTYMKDYLAYQLMAAFGVDTPLCSFVYITVNGEDWGLYLAVEGIEDAFLQRNYGTDYGELYKPDSMSFGGGRGNGKDFKMEDFDFGDTDSDDSTNSAEREAPTFPQGDFDFSQTDFSQMGDMTPPDGMQMPDMPDGFASATDFSPGEMPDRSDSDEHGGKGGMGGGMGSSDVKLAYIDDDPDSYSNIFDNAKTDVTDADEERLIASLKSLSSYENLDNILDVDEVLRYFVVHNFLVNGDSYTGSMIHNYYLYEEDGQLSMIPWDYNLAYGTFQGNNASDAVNDPIDEVLSDRPMQAWIFSDDTYSRQYHSLYQEFLVSVDMQALIDEAYTLIAPYVEKDPTAFCTYEEFEAGVAALKSFCQLRSESVMGQLTGSIPSTDADQSADSSALVDAGELNLSDMGTMNTGGNGGGGGASAGHGGEDSREDGMEHTEDTTEPAADAGVPDMPQMPQGEDASQGQGNPPQMPQGGSFDPSSMPQGASPGGEMPMGGTKP